jgi:murein L,D-transpeptidase YafK
MANMKSRLLRIILLVFAIFLTHHNVDAQNKEQSFRDYQFSNDRVRTAWREYEDTLQAFFTAKNLNWPPKDIFLRAFKSQNEMELWARNEKNEEYQKVKTYNICAISGKLGPKRQQGDKQIPEGYYFIDEYNANSEYYLSLLLNYPNYSDRMLGSTRTGGDIYIHGSCLTVGCLPMTDKRIKEIYTLCMSAKLNGQEYIPVHIYPTHMHSRGINYLITNYPGNTAKQQFWATLKKGYDYFEQYHKLLPVMYAPDGTYVN